MNVQFGSAAHKESRTDDDEEFTLLSDVFLSVRPM